MQNPSGSSVSKTDEDEGDIPENEPPKLVPKVQYPDPVKSQKRKDRVPFKKPMDVIPEKQSVISAKITPSMGTRIDLQYVPQTLYEEGQARPKYLAPKTKKQIEYLEKHRANTYKKFCKYQTIKMADPIPSKKLSTQFEIPSPEPSHAKVVPRKVTPTASWLHPDAQTSEDLALKKPKSGILINETHPREASSDYDSFDLVFSRKPRPDGKPRKKKTKRPGDLDKIVEEGEGVHKRKGKKKKGKAPSKVKGISTKTCENTCFSI